MTPAIHETTNGLQGERRGHILEGTEAEERRQEYWLIGYCQDHHGVRRASLPPTQRPVCREQGHARDAAQGAQQQPEPGPQRRVAGSGTERLRTCVGSPRLYSLRQGRVSLALPCPSHNGLCSGPRVLFVCGAETVADFLGFTCIAPRRLHRKGGVRLRL